MPDSQYINEDGSVKDEIVAMHEAALEASAAKWGYERRYMDELLARVEEQGFIILRDLVEQNVLDNIREESEPHLTHAGRTEFEGHKTRRIYAVIEKTLSCNPLVEHPLVMALLDRLLMPNYLLSQLQVISVEPGEVRQPLHHDDGFYPFPRPRKPFGAALIWAIDDFTSENGATLVYPGSHCSGTACSSRLSGL